MSHSLRPGGRLEVRGGALAAVLAALLIGIVPALAEKAAEQAP